MKRPSGSTTPGGSRRGFLRTVALAAASLPAAAQDERKPANTATRLQAFELTDQFGTSHRVDFPRSRPLLLLVSDRRGSAEVDDWIAPLKKHWGHVADITGVADVGGIPSLFRERIRNAIRENRKSPVMLDFEGRVTRQLECADKTANVFLVDPQGRLALAVKGRPDAAKLSRLRDAFTALGAE